MIHKIKETLKNKKYSQPIIIILLLLSVILIYRHNLAKRDLNELPKVPIQTAKVNITDFPVYIPAIATVTSKDVVTIKTQVTGLLINVNFKDGQYVKKGQLLAEIDPRPYKAQLEQYKGQLLRDQAILDSSKLDLKRYQELWKQNSVSKQILDNQIYLVKQNEGTVLLDQGQVDNAKVNLDYCKIYAPADGKVGIAAVNQGNVVQITDANGIVSFTSMDPIYVLFSIPEDKLSEVVEESNKQTLKVEIYDQFERKLIKTGELYAIDNQINTGTGSITLEAEVKNSDNILFPNQFVNVKLLVKTLHDAVVVPTSAVQYGPNGTFVYLLSEDKTTVKVQPVAVDLIDNNNAVIKSGLSAKQVVAISGVDKLTNNALVLVHSEEPLL